MKILIVGAGIAGLTLAALLKQRGLTPIIIEKSESLSESGYMLGLYPIGANVLRQLNCYEAYLKSSVAGDLYEAYTDKAQLLKQFSFEPIVKQYGPYQLITRYELLDLLHQSCGDLPIRFSTEIAAIEQTADRVQVVLSDESQLEVDLVVGADGLHSHVRRFILNDAQHRYYHTGWGGWVWWAEEGVVPANTIQEYWGCGTFLGVYPVKGKVGVIAAVDSPSEASALQGQSRQSYLQKKFERLIRARPELFSEIPSDEQSVFFWPLNDQRAAPWSQKRVLLLGDAAVAFLPTAGIGASMALESAAVLNDILSRTSVEQIPQALLQFEKRRRRRVEGAQRDSRRLAKMMFVSSPMMAWMRNYFTKMMSIQSLVKSIVKGFDEPI